ncbi:MAG: hypothetical protein DME82_06860 [Verrucomicrobia bacterium]|nr:MAG: hypothetical protein DME82_06860 [Verrucomicrobiota bacterium]
MDNFHAQLKILASLFACSPSRSKARRTAAKDSEIWKMSRVTPVLVFRRNLLLIEELTELLSLGIGLERDCSDCVPAFYGSESFRS